MRLVVAVVGRPRDAGLKSVILDYETRAARYWPLEVHEVREERAASLAPTLVMAQEGKRLREKIPPGARTIVCHQSGERRTSEQFAAMLQSEREAARNTVFIIGGAFGVSSEILESADLRLNLAPWTLPHDIARLLLAEQIYRAGTIVRGEPYHK
jgi:23S rRNA (pseudouridine1915-N3)-methyltransferase